VRTKVVLTQVRQLPWVDAVLRSVAETVATGRADPANPRPAWAVRRPRWLPFRVALFVLADVVVASIILGTTVDQLGGANDAAGGPYSNNYLTLIGLAIALPVVLRNWYPLAAWRSAIVVTGWAAFLVRDLRPSNVVLGCTVTLALCLYSVAVRTGRPVTITAWLLTAGWVWLLAPQSTVGVTDMLIITGAVLFGYNVRVRRLAQQHVIEQEHRLAENKAARTLLEERSRIARELHDVVAHHMSVIAIQAEAAPYKVPNPPPELTASFAEIRGSALEGLTELRRILGVLRSEESAADTTPQPGLDRLEDLVSSARSTGLTVETTVSGEARPLPSGIELSAYRIVQEALSNAMRYAPGARVQVHVRYGPAALELRVINGPPRSGAPGGPDGGGHGLLGMHERTAMLGGELTARATPDGGFSVTATLPLTSGVTA
jgi:signal transduction histidine kinase